MFVQTEVYDYLRCRRINVIRSTSSQPTSMASGTTRSRLERQMADAVVLARALSGTGSGRVGLTRNRLMRIAKVLASGFAQRRGPTAYRRHMRRNVPG